jgi:hypothetical protein
MHKRVIIDPINNSVASTELIVIKINECIAAINEINAVAGVAKRETKATPPVTVEARPYDRGFIDGYKSAAKDAYTKELTRWRLAHP